MDIFAVTEEVHYWDWTRQAKTTGTYVQTEETTRTIISKNYATTLVDRGDGIWNTEAAEKARPKPKE